MISWHDICVSTLDGILSGMGLREVKPAIDLTGISVESQYLMYLDWRYPPLEALEIYKGKEKERVREEKNAKWYGILVDWAVIDTLKVVRKAKYGEMSTEEQAIYDAKERTVPLTPYEKSLQRQKQKDNERGGTIDRKELDLLREARADKVRETSSVKPIISHRSDQEDKA